MTTTTLLMSSYIGKDDEEIFCRRRWCAARIISTTTFTADVDSLPSSSDVCCCCCCYRRCGRSEERAHRASCCKSQFAKHTHSVLQKKMTNKGLDENFVVVVLWLGCCKCCFWSSLNKQSWLCIFSKVKKDYWDITNVVREHAHDQKHKHTHKREY